MFYRFKTRRVACYFPAIKDNTDFFYGIYTPYNLFAKVYWWLFVNCGVLRRSTIIKDAESSFPYRNIVSLLPNECVFSVNMGTPGPEQKISILGMTCDKERFFAKYSQKPRAIELSRNEIKVLKKLKDTDYVPQLYDYKIADSYCYLRTSYVEGKTFSSLNLNREIVNLAIQISKIDMKKNQEDGILLGLSHGDFTPWNILVDHNSYHLIDWEMADERELGYDLFHFLYQVQTLFHPNILFTDCVMKNKDYIDEYFGSFGVVDWTPYFRAFKQRKGLL